MKKVLFLCLLLCSNVFAQKTFEVNTISKRFDLKIEVEKQEYKSWTGRGKFSLFRKGSKKSFQIISLDKTRITLGDDSQPEIFKVADKKSGKWSSLYLEDFNFDGVEDLAIPDGNNGGYGAISYRVYLYSNQKKLFVFSRSFTRLVQGPYMGIFITDNKKKTLETMSKSGCCIHYSEIYKVVRNYPKKVVQISEYYDLGGRGFIETETEKLINGRWRVWNKRKKIKE